MTEASIKTELVLSFSFNYYSGFFIMIFGNGVPEKATVPNPNSKTGVCTYAYSHSLYGQFFFLAFFCFN